MAIYAEAIEVITDTGNGIPTTYTNTALGLASDGHFYLITGRLGLDGTKTVTGDTPRTVWYENILAEDFGAGISRNADFTEAGCMETVSSFAFPVVNTAAFQATLKTNNVHLGKRRVKYYRVTYALIADEYQFELRWQGVIEDQPFNELTQSIQCVSNALDIFRSTPNIPVTTSAFEDAPQESQDKMIPIALGRVAYSPLVNVAKTGQKVTLNRIDSVEYKVAAVSGGGPTGFRLVTRGVTFAANDLAGKYVSVVAGAAPQILRIKESDATEPSGGSEGETTVIRTDDPVDETDPIIVWNQTGSGDGLNLRYAEVVDFQPVLVASSKAITEFKPNSLGRPGLSTYQSDRNRYDDVSEMKTETSISNIEDTGFPGMTLLAKAADSDGSLFAYFNLFPADIKVALVEDWTSEDLPAVGDSATLLFDRLDNSTGYTLTADPAAAANGSQVSFDVVLPSDDLLKQFEEIYILPDFAHNRSGGTPTLNTHVFLNMWGKDIYGRLTESLVEDAPDEIQNSDLGSTDEELFYIPKFYYGSTDEDLAFFANKLRFNVAELIGDSKKSKAFTSIRINLAFSHDDSGFTLYTLKLRQIAVIGKRSVGVTSESLNGTVIGETFGTTWDGRKTTANSLANIGDVPEHLIRNYDTPGSAWAIGRAYVVGDLVRSIADNGHLFVCTEAGTSHATTEPTWTDTAGATYTDGTVTWRELREIPVDTTAFDLISHPSTGSHKDWFFGRTLVEKKKTDQWVKELMAQMFAIGSISPSGKFSPVSWLDNTTPAVAFTSANIIQGTLGDVKLTPASRAYNDFLIRYDWSPGAGKFNKQIFITNVDKPAFPADSADLGAFSVSYTSYSLGFGRYLVVYSFTTTAPHGLVNGDTARLTGNTEGYDFMEEVGVSGANAFTVAFVRLGEPDSEPSTSGVLEYVDPDAEWKRYVGGILDYDTAKDLWDDCHAAYVVTMTVNKLPEALGDCPWFIDPYAKDAAGHPIWATDGVLDLDVGDEHPAVFYLRKLVAWTTRQKEQVEFEVIDNPTHSALQIGSTVSFNDAKLTNGATRTGWIHEKTQLPKAGKIPPRFRLGLTLEPT